MNRAIAIGGIALGAAFIYDGIHGRKLWDDLLSVLRGEQLAADPVSGQVLTGLADGALASSNAATDAGIKLARDGISEVSAKQLQQDPSDVTRLTKLDGSPTNWSLKTDAAAAFQRAQARVGKDIPLTGAYRSLASETERNKTEPTRFPIPNFHTAAMAIDVWNATGLPGWLQAPSQSSQVIAALEAEGFQRFDPDGKRGENMHWSYGGRG